MITTVFSPVIAALQPLLLASVRQPSHVCVVLSEEEQCQIFLPLLLIPPAKKNNKKNPTLNSFKRFFKSELEPMWHFCGWDLAWAQQSRDVEEALSLSGPAGWGRGLGCSRGSGAALRPPDPQPCTVLSGSEHCSAFHTICSELSGPECGDSGSCGGSEPTPALLYGDSLQPSPLPQGCPSPAALPQVWMWGIPGRLCLPLCAQPPPAVPGLPR